MSVPDKISISIVEDDYEIAAEWLRIFLASERIHCCGHYGSAEEAAPAIYRAKPDVVLMDIGLPGKSGIRFCSEIRERLPRTEILICTVFHDPDSIVEALRAGAGGYLLKSASEAELLAAVDTIYTGGSPIDVQIARKVIALFQPERKGMEALSVREEHILSLVARGYRNKEIAEKLFISPETVRTHIRNIYAKLQTNTRMEAVQKYFGTGFRGR